MESRPDPDQHVNDWHDFLHKGREVWDRYGNHVLIVVLAVMVVIFGYRIYTARELAKHQNAWQELSGATSPDSLKNIADESGDPVIASMAYLRAGELLLNKATLPDAASAYSSTQPAAPPDPRDRAADLSRAAEMFKAASEQHDAHIAIRLNALLGLASVSEATSSWDEARRVYATVIAEADKGRFAAIAALAQGRLKMLDRLKEPIIFGPEPVAATQPATQPASGPSIGNNPLSPAMIAQPLSPATRPTGP
ncbi:MAG: hypothetical protein K8S99_09020 [Planctomycetes bacterium]|nr:hypothetical protein [Planctomycetota bacterium]